MNEKKIKHIQKQIEEQEWGFWESNKLADFLTERNIELSKQELFKLTKRLIKEDVFRFLYPIANIIRHLASDDEDFIEILESAIDEIKNDLAQDVLIDSFTFIGTSNPRLAMKIADKLLKSSNPEYSSFLIAGSFHALPEECNVLITKLLSSENSRHQVTAIRAWRVIYKDFEMKDKQNLFNALERALESDFIEVKSEVLQAFVDFYKIDAKNSNRIIENLAKSHTRCKYLLAKRVRFCSPFDEETSLYYLDICSEDSAADLKRHVLYALVGFVKEHTSVVLEILAKYAIRDGYAGDVNYVLNEMGKANAANALVTILDWLRKERNPRLSRYIPSMVGSLVSKTDKKIILEPTFQLIDSDPKFVVPGMNVLLEVISNTYKKDAESEFISVLFDSLARRAKEQGIDVTLVTKNESNKVLQCAEIIHKIKHCSKPLDYDTIFQNLNEFPNIKALFRDSWFEQKRTERNRTHPILKMLEQELPSRDRCNELIHSLKNARTRRDEFNFTFKLKNLMWTACFLYKLDRSINTMKKKGFETNGYSKKLKNESQFSATLSEIDFVVPFLPQYEVEPEPKINSKRLDAKIKIGAQLVYVEVISPDMFKPLAILRGSRSVSNRIKGKIYDEFKHQIRAYSSADQPIIVAIDIGGSEVNYDFVEDYLLGPLKFKVYFDSEKGEAVGSHDYRDETESMHGLEPETDLISAVVCYQTRFYNDLSFQMEGKIFENSHAKIPLNHDVKKIIEEILFSKHGRQDEAGPS